MNINTTNSTLQQTCCSICNKTQITRRHNREAYCANCYAKWFVIKACERCHNMRRIHLSATICRKCENLIDCVRCGKQAGTYAIGKITSYGAVCNACSIYFREERECYECGKLVRNMVRSKCATHNELLCIKCYRKYEFGTCKNCHRYYKIYNIEKRLCKKCDKALSSTCPKCKKDMPSGYGTVCPMCARRALLVNLIRLNVHLFRSKAIKIAYKKFIFWYVKQFGENTVLYKSGDHISFFIACDNNWQSIADYETLILHYKPNGLRSHLTVLRWLIDTKQIVVNEKLKNEVAEKNRIQTLFNKLSSPVPCITSYYNYLQQKYKQRKTTLKSIRLALQPAVDLVVSQGINTYPTQEQLNSYLVKRIGQVAAITGFVNHLKLMHKQEIFINIDSINKVKEKNLKKYCNQRLTILHNQSELSEDDKMELVSIVLYSLHNILVKKINRAYFVEINDTLYYCHNEKKYLVPKDIYLRLTQTK